MARRTQGTSIWAVVSSKTQQGKFELLAIARANNFKTGSDSQEKHDDTCLEDEYSKSYVGGLSDTGQATFDVNLDPKQASHVRLYELGQSSDVVEWVVGWAGAKKGAMKTIVPTIDVNTGVVTLPPSRSWNKFKGYVEPFEFDFSGNALVKTSINIQRTSEVSWITETA